MTVVAKALPQATPHVSNASPDRAVLAVVVSWLG